MRRPIPRIKVAFYTIGLELITERDKQTADIVWFIIMFQSHSVITNSTIVEKY